MIVKTGTSPGQLGPSFCNLSLEQLWNGSGVQEKRHGQVIEKLR